MVKLLSRKVIKDNLKEMGPALGILLATLIISTFLTEFTFNFGLKALWKTLFRFVRLSLLLTLPMFLLPGICSIVEGILNRGKQHLIHAQEELDTAVHPVKNWIFRPLQGIGLSMLLATKLLTVLEIYKGSKVTVDVLLPQGAFAPGHFLGSLAIGVVVSLLLSLLWTLAR